MAEVKCFQPSKNCTKKNINYLRIQRFKRLIHWFHFDPVRDLSHLLIVKTFLLHSAAEFLCERKSSIFWRRQKSCSIHHRQIRLRTPKERAVFSDCLERIWRPQSLSHQPNKILCHPSHPTDFFATQILGGHVTSRNQGLSSNDQGRQRRETLGTRLLCVLTSILSHLMTSSVPNLHNTKILNISGTTWDMTKRKTPFFFTFKGLSNAPIFQYLNFSFHRHFNGAW